ncbi:MAG TPA: PilZ domain-containing protein [Polyangia bacterium]|nr:PilZ domain-containing protein [Polyangia bacterium]
MPPKPPFREPRRARRLKVDYPTEVIGIAAQEVPPDTPLTAVYERVQPAPECIGQRTPFVVRDLSTNGAFLEGPALPLLSRVKFTFELEDHGPVHVTAWTMWRRTAPCTVSSANGPVELPAGVGVLFESMDIDARIEIARRSLL